MVQLRDDCEYQTTEMEHTQLSTLSTYIRI